jgi:hypothetical protein
MIINNLKKKVMRALKKFTFLFFISIIPLLSNGQTIIFQEGFRNALLYDDFNTQKITKDLFYPQSDSSYKNLSPVSNHNSNYIIPAFDISGGVALMTFYYKQDISTIGKNGLMVYYKSDSGSAWKLLAYYSQSEILWKKETLFLPENSSYCSIKFIGSGNNADQILLDNIQVEFYRDASVYSEGGKIYIDSVNNFSSTFIQINASESQISGLPPDNNASIQTRTPGVPVTCPSDAIMEGESDCYTDYVDNYNGGCINNNMFSKQLYVCNGTICGKSGTYTLNGVDKRDVDYYSLQISGNTNATLTVVADFPVKICIIYIPYDICGPSFPSTYAIANSGVTASINYYIPYASTVIFWVAPLVVTGVSCGSNYVMTYNTANISNPSAPTVVTNPSCSPTQLNPMTPIANYTYFWQGSSCGVSTTSPANISYPVNSTGVYYVRGKYTPLGCWTSCSSVSVTINALPIAIFSYSGNPYLNTGTDPSPTYSGGGVAGTFTASPTGLVFIGTAGLVDLSASTPGTYTVTNFIAASGGCADVTATNTIIINQAWGKTLNVSVFVQGLYIGGGMMHEAYDFDGIDQFPLKWAPGIADTVTVELYDDTYLNKVARYPGVNLSTSGLLTISTVNSSLGGSYYITIFQRNSLPITTASPQSFAGSIIYYDFTYPIDQAYGAGLAPQKYLGDGFYGMYTGALDQINDPDYVIDVTDLNILEPVVNVGPFGYLDADLDGSGFVDVTDLNLLEPNVNIGPRFWNPLLFAKKKHSPKIQSN